MTIKWTLVAAYLTVVAIWSTTPLAIQWSGQTDWFFGIAARIFISAILCIPLILWVSKAPFSFQPYALKVYFSAALGMLGGMTPIYFAAQTMPSGWISLIFGLTPIMTGIIAYLFFKHKLFTLPKLIGVVLSLAGLIIILLPKLQSGFQQTDATAPLWVGTLLALMAVFFHSLSTLLVKKYNTSVPSMHVVAGTAWISAITYIIVNPSFILQWPTVPVQALSAIVYLGTFGSIFGFILFYYLLKNIDAIKIGLITLITPVIALMLGNLLNNEPLNATIWTGAAFVIGGLVVFQFGIQPIKNILKTTLKP